MPRRPVARNDDPVPRAIALTLRALRAEQRLTGTRLANALNLTSARKPLDNEGNPKKFNAHTISAIEAAESLTFWQFGHYANWSGIPAPVIHLIAQFTDHIHEDQPDKAKAFAEATIALCQHLLDTLDELSSLDHKSTDSAEFLKAAYKPTGTPPDNGDRRAVVIARALLSAFPDEAKDVMKKHAEERFGGPTPPLRRPPPR